MDLHTHMYPRARKRSSNKQHRMSISRMVLHPGWLQAMPPQTNPRQHVREANAMEETEEAGAVAPAWSNSVAARYRPDQACTPRSRRRRKGLRHVALRASGRRFHASCHYNLHRIAPEPPETTIPTEPSLLPLSLRGPPVAVCTLRITTYEYISSDRSGRRCWCSTTSPEPVQYRRRFRRTSPRQAARPSTFV